MAEHVGRAPDVAITIEKSIPVAGGMAGGSADAAAVLVAINSLWELGVPRRDLHALAAQLGSDVPFALHGGTALGTGRGEELATVLRQQHLPLGAGVRRRRPVHARGVRRDRPAARDDGADRSLPPRLEDPEPVLAALASGDPADLAPLLGNDLQPAALSLDPGLRRTLRAGAEAGALAGIVSGSGPTCAFLCASAAVGRRRRRRAGRRGGVPHGAGGQRAGARRAGGARADAASVTRCLNSALSLAVT